MEIIEEQDSFSIWMESVDRHYPNARKNKELMSLIVHTFCAGYAAGADGKDIGIVSEIME